jgi:uncharacterized protein
MISRSTKVFLVKPRLNASSDFGKRLSAIARESAWFMSALFAVRGLGLASWCIGAGAVRNLVWDHLHELRTPSALTDIDVAYFDSKNLAHEHDAAFQQALTVMLPNMPWEVTNQAAVHLWFENHFGHAVSPLLSLEEAVASWPEYATCVGITLEADNNISIIAPHGLGDLFDIIVRRNPVRVSVETYRERIAAKQYQARWPRVSVIPS